jgi:Ca-activated chloride channel homolog
MRNKSYFAACILLLLGWVGSAVGQQFATDSNLPQGAALAAGALPSLGSNGAWIFRKEVNEVTVMFTATNKGKFVTDLGRGEVQVRDDKRPPAEILDFRSEEDLPLRLGLLIDTSGSVNDRFHFELEAASQFADQVLTAQRDLAFVAGFSHHVRTVQPFTSDRGAIARGLHKLQDDQGDTAVYDAIAEACKKLASNPEQQPVARVLVLVSDGDDNASQLKLDEVTRIAQADEVTLYTISTNARGINLIGDDALQKLGEESGGRALFPGSSKQVSKAFARIRDELRSRYAVSYRPAEFKPDGRFRRIKIVAKRFGRTLHVHARKGYFARE